MENAMLNDHVFQTLGTSHFAWILPMAQEEAVKTAAANPTANDYMHQIVTSHFAWGFALGLLLVLFTWLSGLAKRGEARREVRRLREHLNTQMDITQRGNSAMKVELDTLKTQNENLRVQVREWQTKPGRGEMRQLAVYDRAIRILNQNAPGFSPVWEKSRQGERGRNRRYGYRRYLGVEARFSPLCRARQRGQDRETRRTDLRGAS